MNSVNINLETRRLIIQDSKLVDLSQLKILFGEFAQLMKPYNGNSWHESDVEKQLLEGDLPPGGVIERYQHRSIFDKKSQRLIGFMEQYNGYPSEDIYYIGSLYIAEHCRAQGFGREVINTFVDCASHAGFKAIRVAVDIKNWPAINFWFALGFSKITKISSDKIISPVHFMSMELELVM